MDPKTIKSTGKGKRPTKHGEGDAAAGVDRYMFHGAEEHIEALRSAGGWGRKHDIFEARLVIPEICNGEITPDCEDVYVRQVISPQGLLEQFAARLNALCDEFEGNPREAEGGNRAEAAGSEPKSESSDEQSADNGGPDICALLTDADLAAVESFRAGIRRSHYAGRDYCSISVQLFNGQFSPEETEYELLKMPIISAQPRTIERVCSRVAALAREFDRHSQPNDYRANIEPEGREHPGEAPAGIAAESGRPAEPRRRVARPAAVRRAAEC
jgi:hypothetical protein